MCQQHQGARVHVNMYPPPHVTCILLLILYDSFSSTRARVSTSTCILLLMSHVSSSSFSMIASAALGRACPRQHDAVVKHASRTDRRQRPAELRSIIVYAQCTHSVRIVYAQQSAWLLAAAADQRDPSICLYAHASLPISLYTYTYIYQSMCLYTYISVSSHTHVKRQICIETHRLIDVCVRDRYVCVCVCVETQYVNTCEETDRDIFFRDRVFFFRDRDFFLKIDRYIDSTCTWAA